MSQGGETDTRFATYGTLAPGRINHHQLAGLKGRWRKGTVRGRLVDAGWGAALGFPGLVLDPLGPDVEVDLFESAELPDHWSHLDAFEGTGYRRVVAHVWTADGELPAWIYVVAAKAVLGLDRSVGVNIGSSDGSSKELRRSFS